MVFQSLHFFHSPLFISEQISDVILDFIGKEMGKDKKIYNKYNKCL